MLVFSTRIPAEMFEVGEKWACRTVDGHLVDKGLVLGQVKDNEFDMSGIFMKMTPVKRVRRSVEGQNLLRLLGCQNRALA